MILTVNIGNTHITVGGYEQDTLRFCGRLHSDMDATVDEYAIRLVNLLSVISADTAISMMAVNAKQELVGGVILPGPQLSLSALVKNTAQLPQIDLAAKAPASILGKSTSSCLQNGFVLGTASLLDGLAERFCAELGPHTAFYATGSLPAAIREACRTPILYRETLITDGLYRIWMKNKKG